MNTQFDHGLLFNSTERGITTVNGITRIKDD